MLTRADITPGLQAAQAAHACFQLAVEHPTRTRAWYEGSNCLVLLSVPDEPSLLRYAAVAADAGVAYSLFTEPDLGGEHTALAVVPSGLANRFSDLPLLGRPRSSCADRFVWADMPVCEHGFQFDCDRCVKVGAMSG